MSFLLASELQLPLDLPGPPASVWQWVLIWGLWLVGLAMSGAGIVALFAYCWSLFFNSRFPVWIPVLAFMAWSSAQFLAWWMGTLEWQNIAVNSAAVGVVLFFIGLAVHDEMDGLVLFATVAMGGLIVWLTWPKTKDGLAWISNQAVSSWSGNSAGKGLGPATMESARAELDRCLAWWKSHPGEPYLDRSQFQYMLGDLHMGTGFELKSYQIGPGREFDVGSFEFRVSMELARFRLSTGDQALFPEKTYLVAKQPSMDTWMIQDQTQLKDGNVEGLMQELLPDNPGF